MFVLPLHHEWAKGMFIRFFTDDLFHQLSVSVLIIGFWLIQHRRYILREPYLFYLCLAVGMLGSSIFLRMHPGGHFNVLMTAHAAIAILLGVATHSWLATFKGIYTVTVSYNNDSHLSISSNHLTILFLLAVLLQFFALYYNPRHFLPSPEDWEANRHLIATIGKFDGEVLAFPHGYYPVLAGKASHAHKMAVVDVLRGDSTSIREDLLAEIRNKIQNQQFAAIILDDVFDVEEVAEITKEYYYPAEKVYSNAGFQHRPETVFLPKKFESSQE